ncbi:unnamed protein product [Bursaphelenchus xylophilus]|uniref:(pine wood nematode) hypothetical protein n=1 Tax=Bursaphelenchus xylophilus TaxID=6326 RepID=A0A1I7SDF4_BURXY|nr:unnamed protein product [Bursaphelenchus xylophilus]CAG9130655.1 unnamed protein product [Bursaphelenchus xylophilus]
MPILVVPIYGIYLVISRISIPNAVLGHSVPYLRYKAQMRAKSWLRADMAISMTLACASFGFGCVLFFGYFKTRSGSSYFLKAAITSVLVSFLYLIDVFLATRQLSSASVQFIKEVSVNAFATPTSKDLKAANNPRQVYSNSYQVQENVVYQPYQPQPHNQSQNSQNGRKECQMENVKRKESSWFDEERKVETNEPDNNFWIYHSYERHLQPEENHYRRVLKDSEIRNSLAEARNPQNMTFMGSDEDLPPPPAPPKAIHPQTLFKQTQFPRRVPVPPQRSTESFESTSRTIPRINLAHISSRSSSHHGTINPPAYKARMIVVEDEEITFDRSHSSGNKKGSLSDGSTVRIDDVDKRSY